MVGSLKLSHIEAESKSMAHRAKSPAGGNSVVAGALRRETWKVEFCSD